MGKNSQESQNDENQNDENRAVIINTSMKLVFLGVATIPLIHAAVYGDDILNFLSFESLNNNIEA